MSQFSDITDYLLDTLRSSQVATVAGKAPDRWSLYHVAYGRGPFIREMNRGRVPFCHLESLGFTNTVEFQPNNGGTKESRYRVTCHALVKGLNQYLGEELAHSIINKFLEVVRTNNNVTEGDESSSQVLSSPYGVAVSVDFSIITSFDNSSR